MNSKAIVYSSELDFISRCILDYPDIETGGDLFGFWTYSGFPVIQYAIGPGPKSYRDWGFFKQDIEYLKIMGKSLRERHGLQHIGEWHSHHTMGLAEPSGHDVNTVIRAINNYNLGKFFLVIGNIRQKATTVNGFMFRKNDNNNHEHTAWVILESESPIRSDVDQVFSKDLIHVPDTLKPNHHFLLTTTLDEAPLIKANFSENSWLSTKEGQNDLKVIFEYLQEDFGKARMYLDKETNSTLTISLENGKNVIFPSNYPDYLPFIESEKNKNFITAERKFTPSEIYAHIKHQLID